MSQDAPAFTARRKVRFGDVDAAGMAFYPRYFEMLNEAVEDWMESLGWSFARMHLEQRAGIPARRVEADFTAASRLGDELEAQIFVDRIGRTSAELRVAFACAGEPRWTARMTIVFIDIDAGRSLPWPDDLRAKMQA